MTAPAAEAIAIKVVPAIRYRHRWRRRASLMRASGVEAGSANVPLAAIFMAVFTRPARAGEPGFYDRYEQ
jgi:hypothetical protein